MKIDFQPSEKSLAKARRINELKDQGKSYEEIVKEIGNHRTYIIALHHWYLKFRGGKHE